MNSLPCTLASLYQTYTYNIPPTLPIQTIKNKKKKKMSGLLSLYFAIYSALFAERSILFNPLNTTSPCSVRGYVVGSPIPFSITSTYTNLTTCIELCRATNGACKSFSYLSGCGPGQDYEALSSDVNYIGIGADGAGCNAVNTCELYAKSVMPFLRVDSESPVRWWDMVCFEPPEEKKRGNRTDKSQGKVKSKAQVALA